MIPLAHYKICKPFFCKASDHFSNVALLISSNNLSKNLFLFLLINLIFAFAELFYGILSNSLGLISDAFHMFLDCTCLVTSLVATVIIQWKPNERFSLGYARIEVLAGFANGMFLIFVALFILAEAVERLIEPQEVKHDRLFVVSCLGLVVNLVGIYVFQRGHYEHHKNDNFSSSVEQSQIMKSILLHIFADTLGSLSIIVSSFLVHFQGWIRADPVCSIVISLLILFSVAPLIRDSVDILMQRQPISLDNQLPQCYQKVMQLAGVYSIQEPHFWTLCNNKFVGALKLEVSTAADSTYIITHTQQIFASIGVKQLYVQLDFSPSDLLYYV
ncbi:hypothetical protein GE061_008364 [Apolygus lucorum]|uniref:Cation efflux protein transmembrane domain-containing protein n=1 Tax=Apolygus lucorum TaxID=248454 RepID=A0A6A4IW55_APOLU|nr:hypothetical protein GE061_008364 [Apolygus lucorum]